MPWCAERPPTMRPSSCAWVPRCSSRWAYPIPRPAPGGRPPRSERQRGWPTGQWPPSWWMTPTGSAAWWPALRSPLPTDCRRRATPPAPAPTCSTSAPSLAIGAGTRPPDHARPHRVVPIQRPRRGRATHHPRRRRAVSLIRLHRRPQPGPAPDPRRALTDRNQAGGPLGPVSPPMQRRRPWRRDSRPCRSVHEAPPPRTPPAWVL